MSVPPLHNRDWEDSTLKKLEIGLFELSKKTGTAFVDWCVTGQMNYLQLLVHWNSVYNLTAIRNPHEMVTRHILDSLVIRNHLLGLKGTVLDLGTGPGLPGIPLALSMPELNLTLLDSNAKKTRFLRQAIATLGLRRVRVVRTRAETYTPETKYSVILTRAYAPMAVLMSDAARLLAPEGRILAMKGRFDPSTESIGDDWSFRAHPLDVPGLSAARCLVELFATNGSESATMPRNQR